MGQAEYAGLAGFFNGFGSSLQERFKLQQAKEEQMRQEEDTLKRALILKEMEKAGKLMVTEPGPRIPVTTPVAGPTAAGAVVPTLMPNFFNPAPAPDPAQAFRTMPSAESTQRETTPQETLDYLINEYHGVPTPNVSRQPVSVPPGMRVDKMDANGNVSYTYDTASRPVYFADIQGGKKPTFYDSTGTLTENIPAGARVLTMKNAASGAGAESFQMRALAALLPYMQAQQFLNPSAAVDDTLTGVLAQLSSIAKLPAAGKTNPSAYTADQEKLIKDNMEMYADRSRDEIVAALKRKGKL